MKKISIGIPVRNEFENIPYLIRSMEKVSNDLEKIGFEVELLVNNNASIDSSLELIIEWTKSDNRVKAFNFESQISYQNSILELMRRSSGDAFVVYQSDMQDPPELIIDFVQKWITTDGIVIGKITNRKEGFKSSFFVNLFYRILKIASDGRIYTQLQDFYLLPKEVYEQLSRLSPEGLFLRGHISSRFANIYVIKYCRDARIRGKSNFNFVDKYKLALDGILLFGTRIIRIFTIGSLLVFSLGSITFLSVVVLYLLGYKGSQTGWTSIILLIILLISFSAVATSLILEYLIRIYRFLVFDKSKNIPKNIS